MCESPHPPGVTTAGSDKRRAINLAPHARLSSAVWLFIAGWAAAGCLSRDRQTAEAAGAAANQIIYFADFERNASGWTRHDGSAAVVDTESAPPALPTVLKPTMNPDGVDMISGPIRAAGGTHCLSAWLKWEGGSALNLGVIRSAGTGGEGIKIDSVNWLIGRGNLPDGAGSVVTPVRDEPHWIRYRRTFSLPDGTRSLRLVTDDDKTITRRGSFNWSLDGVTVEDGACLGTLFEGPLCDDADDLPFIPIQTQDGQQYLLSARVSQTTDASIEIAQYDHAGREMRPRESLRRINDKSEVQGHYERTIQPPAGVASIRLFCHRSNSKGPASLQGPDTIQVRTADAPGSAPSRTVHIDPAGFAGTICVDGTLCGVGVVDRDLSIGPHTVTVQNVRADEAPEGSAAGTLTVNDDGSVSMDAHLSQHFEKKRTNGLVGRVLVSSLHFGEYRGRIWVSGVFDGQGPGDRVIRLLSGFRYAVSAPDSLDLRRVDSHLSSNQFGLVVAATGTGLTLDEQTRIHIDQRGTSLTLKTVEVGLDFAGYLGRIYTDSGPIDQRGPGISKARLLTGRCYALADGFSRDLVRDDQWLSSDPYSFCVNDAGTHLDVAHVNNVIEDISANGVLMVRLKPADITVDFDKYPGRITVSGVLDVQGPEATSFRLLRGRRYAMAAPNTRNLLRPEDPNGWLSSAQFGLGITADGTDLTLDPETSLSLSHDKLALKMRVAQAGLDFSGHAVRFSLAGVTEIRGPGFAPLPLLINRRYEVALPGSRHLELIDDDLSPVFGLALIGADAKAAPNFQIDKETGRSLEARGLTLKLQATDAGATIRGTFQRFCLAGVDCAKTTGIHKEALASSAR